MLRRYAFTWCYLGIYVVTEIVYAVLSPSSQNTFSVWASTSVVNLEHNPLFTLVVSAFVGQGDYLAWPVLIALALFGANRALGNMRTLAICLAGNVIGSLVSEGIIAYRVDAGQLPVTYRHLIDVGPSYVVMAAIVVALLCGGWVARVAAAFDLGILVFIGNIFGGLSSLDVAAVGHLVSGSTAAACVAGILVYRRRAQQSGYMPDGDPDQVRNAGGGAAEHQLPDGPAPERPLGQPGY
jgi:hypothetical protein